MAETPAIDNLKISAEESTKAPVSVEQTITPWEVEGAIVDGKAQEIDYDRLIEQFGTKKIDAKILERFEKVTGYKPHLLLRRGMFFSER